MKKIFRTGTCPGGNDCSVTPSTSNDVLVIGKGYIGTGFKAYGENISLIEFPTDATTEILKRNPKIVINAIGKTGNPNVDWCETYPKETTISNINIALELLFASLENNSLFVHISSGCIFNGTNDGKGFAECNTPNFSGSFYVKTKRCVETIIAHFPTLIVRPRMVFDGRNHPKNTVRKISQYQKVINTKNSMTYLPDFVTTTLALARQHKTGIYHIVNDGVISPSKIAKIYQEQVDPYHRFVTIADEELKDITKAERSTTYLNTDKIKSNGIKLPDIRTRIEQSMQDLKRNLTNC